MSLMASLSDLSRPWKTTILGLYLLVMFLFAQGKKEPVTVWAITTSKIYQCPGSVWYGRGEGKQLNECQALREGFKPALGRGCGSDCQ